MDKPSVYKSLLFYGIVGNARINQALPISNLHILEENDTCSIMLEYEIKDLPSKLDRLIICYSTDPYMEWAGDWSHLGTFRLRIAVNNVTTAAFVQGMTTFICKKEDFQEVDIIFEGRQ